AIGPGVAAPRDPGGGDGVDVLFRPVPVVVAEGVRAGRQAEDPAHHRRHLGPGYGCVRAHPGVRRRVAAAQDPRPGQRVDLVLGEMAVVVDEGVRAPRRPDHPLEHGGELTPGHVGVGTGQTLGAAVHQAPIEHLAELVFVDAVVVVDERVDAADPAGGAHDYLVDEHVELVG